MANLRSFACTTRTRGLVGSTRYLATAFGLTAMVIAAPSAVAQNTTIKVLVSSGHQQFNPVWERLDDFEAESGIHVELDKVNTVDVESKALQDLRLGGCTYDNLEILDGAMANIAPLMANLEPFIEKGGTDVAAFKDQFASWSVNAATFEGKLKYHPFYSGAKAIAYRKDLFEDPENQAQFKERFGYEFPLPPKTPKELLDLAAFFTRGDMWGLVFSGAGDSAETTFADLAFRAGIDGYTDHNNNAMWGPKNPDNQAPVITAARYLQDLVRKHKVAPPEVTGMGTGEAVSFYSAGNAAMVYDTIYLSWAEFNADNVISVIGESGSFEPPSFKAGEGGIPFWWARGIPECSDNKEAAWKFMQWVMSDENLKLALTEGLGVFVPTNKDMLQWSVEQGVLPKGVADAVTSAKVYTITPSTGQIRKSLVLPEVEKLLQNALTPEEFAEVTGEIVQEELERAGLAK